MQEDLEELGVMNLNIPPSQDFSAEMLAANGITAAVVTKLGNRMTLYSLYTQEEGYEEDEPVKTPRELLCIRENPHASLFLDGQLYQGDEACKRCANCLMCFTKNKFAQFIINDNEQNSDPLAGLW